MQRTIVVGDIHGAFRALQEIIKKIGLKNSDTLIFLGDLGDGWSQTFEVVQYLLELGKTTNCVFIKGNHDAWLEEWLMDGNSSEDWLTSGGQATVDSYRGKSNKEKSLHLSFIRNMHHYFVDGANRLFIHAGFASVRGPENERYSSNYSWDRTLWELALCMDERLDAEDVRYPKRLKLFKEIYIGHTPTLRIGKDVPVNAVNVWNVDTGAAFNGKLSAIDVDTKEIWQSQPVLNLYPGEKGRNGGR